jgi:hypothetical protein
MKYQICCVSCVLLLFTAGGAWPAGQPASSNDTPAILAALDAGSATILDDQAASAVRGQEYKYVLVKILGLNTLDFGPGVQWTWNPLGYRYGAWGGLGWTNNGSPADAMDDLFKQHDNGATDQWLVNALKALPDSHGNGGFIGYWGKVYVPGFYPAGAPASVYVSGASFIGGKIFLGWRAMPYTEYSRREALIGMSLLTFGR